MKCSPDKIIFFYYFFHSSIAYSNISSTIISKVDNEVITTIDLENELKTFFILNNIDFKKENIESYKNQLLDVMIKRLVKKMRSQN